MWVNTHIPLIGEMPHGGFKHSGYGKDLSMYGLEDYTRVKHVMIYHGFESSFEPAAPSAGRRAGPMHGDHDPHHQPEGDLLDKELSEGAVGLFGGTVLGISSVAPAYALTATIGILVAEAGNKMPVYHHRRLPADVLRRLRLPQD